LLPNSLNQVPDLHDYDYDERRLKIK
jgi:hypothetical protein